jgi:hypothetical protein
MENDESNIFSFVSYVFIAAVTFALSHHLATVEGWAQSNEMGL